MKTWITKSSPSDQVKNLSTQLKISPLIAHLLMNRGINDIRQAQAFLYDSLKDLPKPFLLKDMDKAVDRIVGALENKEKIVIYGDYDVDGTVASSLLILFFEEIGHPVDFYVPHRIKEGYSLNEGALKKIKEGGARVIITVDNGVAANTEADVALKLGIDLIITDHHQPPDVLPKAYALVNPHRADCLFPAKEICGAGVAFYLAMALRQKLRDAGWFKKRKEPNLKKYLDLVALATVADVVPLIGVNRIFVKAGLGELAQSQKPGIKALKEVSDVGEDISASHLGFRLGPRLNACGRLYDASIGIKMLISKDLSEARELANKLNEANQERKNVERKILKEAILQLENDPESDHRMAHVLYDEKWHPGVIGIVASRIAERTHRPVILLGSDGDCLKGSARSYGGLNLVEALRECESHLLKCGGHKAAAGLSLNPDKLQDFKEQFNKIVSQKISPDDCLAHLNIDAELSLREVNMRLLEELKVLAPFGQSNPEPLFCLKKITPRFSRIVGEKHLKFKANDGDINVSAIAFGMGEKIDLGEKPVHLATTCELNTYQGIQSVSLNVKDIKLS